MSGESRNCQFRFDSMTEIATLLGTSDELRKGVGEILTRSSPESVDEEILKRETFRNELADADRALAKEVDNIRALRRGIDSADDWQATDIKSLISKKFDLI